MRIIGNNKYRSSISSKQYEIYIKSYYPIENNNMSMVLYSNENYIIDYQYLMM